MKLYFSPGACSLSPHIVLREAGAKFDSRAGQQPGKRRPSRASILDRSTAKGQVPVLDSTMASG